jgi:hypothetical protein
MKYIFFILILASCSGYRFRRTKNPFAPYGITKLSMPMFINRTPLPQVTGPITREFIELFNGFPDLKLFQGENAKGDALLLGIIYSDKDIRNTITPESRQFVASGDVGTRRRFLIPAQSKLTLSLRLVLIKDPNYFDKKLLTSDLGKFIKSNPKVIFDKTLELSQHFNRANIGKEGNGVDAGGVVNFTNNKGSEKVMVALAAEEAVKNFKELVLYAF